jgi:hypothetical protein
MNEETGTERGSREEAWEPVLNANCFHYSLQSKSQKPLATSSSFPLIRIPIRLLPPFFDDDEDEDEDEDEGGVAADADAADAAAGSEAVGEANSINLLVFGASSEEHLPKASCATLQE